jgi:hypothetical protein
MMTFKNKAETMRLAKRNSLRLGLAWALAALGLGTTESQADLQFRAKGKEFDVAGSLIGDQHATHAAISAKGGFLVWQDNATDESGLGISALRLDAAANAVGAPFRVNANVAGNQEKPKVGLLANGGAIFAWEAGETGFRRVQFRASNAEGMFIGEEVFATSAESGEQTDPSVAVLRNGTAAITWTDYLMDGSVKGLAGRIVMENGEALSESFRLNEFTKGNQYGAQLQSLPNGGFAAVWASDQQQSEKSIDIVARLFNSVGQPLTDEVIVNQPGISSNPVLGVAGDRLMVAWEQVNLDNKKTRWDIHMRSFDLNLKPMTEALAANQQREGDQFAPSLKGNAEGAMLVWNSLGQDGSREAVMGRFLNEKGLFEGEEFVVNNSKFAGQVDPNVSATANGDWLVTWSTPKGDGNGMEVAGQRFGVQNTDAIGEQPVEPVSVVFVNPLGEGELMISWPEVGGMDVAHYAVYIDDVPDPKNVNGNYFVWRQLQPGREYAFRVVYELSDGRRSPMSAYGFNRTWGRDFNEDGLPDDWQREHFGRDATKWPDSADDSDNDGASNEAEFLADTNPVDDNSVLKLKSALMEQGQRLSWQAEAGSVYQVEKASRLGSGNVEWKNEGSPVLALEGEAGLTVEAGEKMSFYRIKRIR